MSNIIKSKNTRQMLFVSYNKINYLIYYAFLQLSKLLHKTITCNDFINDKTSNKKLAGKSDKNTWSNNRLRLQQNNCFRTFSQVARSINFEKHF